MLCLHSLYRCRSQGQMSPVSFVVNKLKIAKRGTDNPADLSTLLITPSYGGNIDAGPDHNIDNTQIHTHGWKTLS